MSVTSMEVAEMKAAKEAAAMKAATKRVAANVLALARGSTFGDDHQERTIAITVLQKALKERGLLYNEFDLRDQKADGKLSYRDLTALLLEMDSAGMIVYRIGPGLVTALSE